VYKRQLLLSPEEMECMLVLRRLQSSLGVQETTELLIDRLKNTSSNQELVELITKSQYAENMRS